MGNLWRVLHTVTRYGQIFGYWSLAASCSIFKRAYFCIIILPNGWNSVLRSRAWECELHYITSNHKKSMVVIDIIYRCVHMWHSYWSNHCIMEFYSHVNLSFIYVFRASLGRERLVMMMMLNANVCTEDLISLIVNLRERQNGLQRRPHGRMLRTILLKVQSL